MKRVSKEVRPNWIEKVEDLGFDFHHVNGEIYWDESAAYEFSLDQIDRLDDATTEMHHMCLHAVSHIITHDLFAQMEVPEKFKSLLIKSWDRGEFSIYGRFDWCWDGVGDPKLLEYNADTPTALFEASVVQWHWLEDQNQGRNQKPVDQFNSIHEKLIDSWKKLPELNGKKQLHLMCVRDNLEDLSTVKYLADTARQAGVEIHGGFVDEIGWTGVEFVDIHNLKIQNCFKLYPWEWMLEEQFQDYLLTSSVNWIEPLWKLLLSNKNLLPLLWKMYEGHPNLLPAYWDSSKFKNVKFVEKSTFSREGSNIKVIENNQVIDSTEGPYVDSGKIYQQFVEMPNFFGNYPVIGSWIIGGKSAGLGIREDRTAITKNSSRFIPHYFLEH